MEELETFSRVMFVDECLLDKRRTEAFQKAISSVVRRGDLVLDAGTGSGIMALFAARAGARKVFAVEIDEESAMLANESFAANPEGKKIRLVHADIRSFESSRPFDVVIMELLDTGLIAEQQAQAINALRRRGLIDSNTRIVPKRVECGFELLNYDFRFYGFDMPMVLQARNNGANRNLRRRMSGLVNYRIVDFSKVVRTAVKVSPTVEALHTGVVNALRLRTKAVLVERQELWETSDMNMPVIVPVRSLGVDRGETLRVDIRYLMGHGYDTLRVKLTRVR